MNLCLVTSLKYQQSLVPWSNKWYEEKWHSNIFYFHALTTKINDT